MTKDSTDATTNKVWVYWSEREKDLMVNWDSERTKANPRYILGMFTQEHLDELDRRGYDITTLRFSIKKKQQSGESSK